MKKKILALLCLLAVSQYTLQAQEFGLLGLFGKGKSMKLNGGINTSFLYSHSSDDIAGREPFTMVLGGNINLFYKGVNIPLSFSYSNAKVSVSPPMYFNKCSIHPNYKWVTAHIGTTALTFSPYTLNGHQFDGGGLELTPGKLKLKMMYGRLLRGTGDYELNKEVLPTYKRMGQGIAGEYEYKGVLLGFSAFHAKDDSGTAYHIPYELATTPKENFATSVNTAFTVPGGVKITAEYASSYLTQDLRSIAVSKTGDAVLSRFIHKNGSTGIHHALNAKAVYTFGLSEAGLAYERVDPDYQCLGAYYNQNAFENMLARYSTSLFNNKLFIAPAIGLQKDLSDSTSSQQSRRLLTTFNATYNPIDKLTISGSFGNTSSVTNYRNLDNIASGNNIVPYYLDSLKLVQLNMNASLDATYLLQATKDRNQSITGSYSLQRGTKKQGDYFVDEEANNYHNASLNFSTSYPQTTVLWMAGMNYTLATMGAGIRTTAYGPNFSFGKKLMNKKLNAMLGVSYNTTKTNTTQTYASIMNTRCNLGYKYRERNDFKFSGIWQMKNSGNHITGEAVYGSELLFSLIYNYNF
jgi:hypothetical protein